MSYDFLLPNEQVLMDGKANKTVGAGTLGAKGGSLILTDNRLVFKAHAFNIGSQFQEFPLSQIALTGNTLNILCPTPNSIRVTMRDGTGHTFIVVGKDKERWKQAISSIASQNYQANMHGYPPVQQPVNPVVPPQLPYQYPNPPEMTQNAKKKSSLPIIMIAVVAVLMLIVGVLFGIYGKGLFKGAETKYGNTPGNISNLGIMAEDGDYIYFCEQEEAGWGIYKAKADGTDNQKISDKQSLFLNVQGDWVYYLGVENSAGQNGELASGAIFRMKTDGSNVQKLNDDISMSINVVDDYIYYLSIEDIGLDNPNMNICRMKTDGTKKQALCNVKGGYMNVVDGYIYYTEFNSFSDDDQGQIYKMKTDGTGNQKICNDVCSFINVAGEWVYYINYSDDKIYRIKTDGTNRQKLSDDEATAVNVCEEYVFFINQTNNNYIYRMNVDGSNSKRISNVGSGDMNVILTANQYVYFSDGEEWQKAAFDGTSADIIAPNDKTTKFLTALKNTDMVSFFGFHTAQAIDDLVYETHVDGPIYREVYSLKNNTFQGVYFMLDGNSKMESFLAFDLKEVGIAFNSDSINKIYDVLGQPNVKEQRTQDGDDMLYSSYDFEDSTLFISINDDKTIRFFNYQLKAVGGNSNQNPSATTPSTESNLLAAPNLVGMDFGVVSDPTNAIGKNFNVVIEREEYSDIYAEVFIISQDISPGQMLPKGSTIKVVVSKGESHSAVPPVIGMDYDAAVAVLNASGYYNIVRVNVEDGSVGVGIVINMEPSAYSKVDTSKKITLYVNVAEPS